MEAGMRQRVTRHFVTLDQRQVHYRRAGSGPPIVMLHESPRSSSALAALAAALGERCTAIALDTPGYGYSDPLAPETPEIPDYGDALVETLDALGIERCGLYGALTGSLIALDAAARHPDRFAAVVLEHLPVFSDEERAEFLANYLPPFESRADGTHLLWAWLRIRDQYTFWPWYGRSQTTRLPLRLPSPRTIHDGALDLLRAGDGYRVAYAAAFRYRPDAALATLAVPTALVLRGETQLGEHLDRLPPLSPSCTTDRLPADRNGYVDGLLRHLSPALELPEPPAPATARDGRAARAGHRQPAADPSPGRTVRGYVETSHGQLLVRRAGAGGPRPLLMLHASPGSGLALEPLQSALAPTREVLVLDTLGNGASDKPSWQEAEIADYAQVVVEAIDALGLEQLDLYGTHTGAHIAIEVALAAGARVRSLILEGVAMLSPEERDEILEQYFVSLEPRWDGTHLYSAWLLLRDGCLWFPWYRRTPEARLGARAFENPARFHRQVVDLLSSGESYPIAYRAAFRYPTRERLPFLRERGPTLLCTHPGDPLHSVTQEAAELAGAEVATLPGGPAETAAMYAEFLG